MDKRPRHAVGGSTFEWAARARLERALSEMAATPDDATVAWVVRQVVLLSP